MILREELAGTYEVLMDRLRKHDSSLDMLNVAMMLGNAGAIKMAVKEGWGIALVSRLAAARGLELGRIVEVDAGGMVFSREIYLARNRKQSLTRARSEFWKFTREIKKQITIQHKSSQVKEASASHFCAKKM